MLVQERKSRLMAELAERGRVVAKEASRSLGVSEDTIRRDLRELARDGRLKRVHGGAVPGSPAVAPFSGRVPIGESEKAEIACEAARMVEDAQVVFLDGGTTALQVARSFPPGLRATVMTHSPNVALELMAHEGLTIELVGGRLFRHSVVTVGATTMAMIERCRPDIAFIGATGIHPDYGITTGDGEEAAIKRAVILRSGASFVLGSSEKIGAVSPFEVAGLGEIDGVIATAKAGAAVRAALEAQGCPVVIAAGA